MDVENDGVVNGGAKPVVRLTSKHLFVHVRRYTDVDAVSENRKHMHKCSLYKCIPLTGNNPGGTR